MLTGVEIAGTVLAVLPLVISALEQYNKGSKPIKTFLWKWDIELKNLIRCLKDQKYFFRLSLQRLVLAADLHDRDEEDVSQSEDLLKLLEDSDARSQLEDYVDSNEGLEFLDDVLETYSASLNKILKKLMLVDGTTETKIDDMNAFLKLVPSANGLALKKRFEFTMKQGKMKDIIKELNECNEKLRIFVEAHQDLNRLKSTSNTTQDSNARRMAASFQKVREHANSLHAAIAAGWSSNCHPAHESILVLESRSAMTVATHMAGLPNKASTFRVLLSSAPIAGTDIRTWHETTVSVVGDLAPQSSTKKEVQDLCQRIARARAPGQALLMDLTKSNKLYCCEMHTVSAWLSCKGGPPTSVSLEQCLMDGDTLSMQEGTKLALNIASSLLQLHTTEWCRTSWTKQAIRFFRQTVGSKTITDPEKPFISRRFPDQPTPLPSDAVRRDILEMGILLIEIWEQRTFESWAAGTNLALRDEYLDRMFSAMRWFEAAKVKMTPSYSDAVEVCVKFLFGRVDHNWDNPNFRRAFCEMVISPLLENCRAWNRSF